MTRTVARATLRYAVLRCGWRRNEAMLTLVTAQPATCPP